VRVDVFVHANVCVVAVRVHACVCDRMTCARSVHRRVAASRDAGRVEVCMCSLTQTYGVSRVHTNSDIFCAFDDVVARHGLLKIKTIGDGCVWCV
jgi:hypothetical protein